MEGSLDVRPNVGKYESILREHISLTGGALPQKFYEIKSVDERQPSNYSDWDGWDDASRAVRVPDEDRFSMNSNSNTTTFQVLTDCRNR
jgi:hypothetical protein